MKRARIYVGCKQNNRILFRSILTPTEETHGNLYAAVIGPFSTHKGAQFMAKFGAGNPHCQCVADAEHLAKWYEKHEALHRELNEKLNLKERV